MIIVTIILFITYLFICFKKGKEKNISVGLKSWPAIQLTVMIVIFLSLSRQYQDNTL
jgi:hypothetical protein